jgi:hypothetical protein
VYCNYAAWQGTNVLLAQQKPVPPEERAKFVKMEFEGRYISRIGEVEDALIPWIRARTEKKPARDQEQLLREAVAAPAAQEMCAELGLSSEALIEHLQRTSLYKLKKEK